MPSKTVKSFVAGDDLSRKIASEAARRNMSVSSYLKEALKLYFALDHNKIEQVAKISSFLDLDTPEVVNEMLRAKLESILNGSKEDSC